MYKRQLIYAIRKLIFNYVSGEISLHLRIIQLWFGIMTCHVCYDGWSVWSSGDVSYGVDRVYSLASKAASESMRV